MPSYELQLHPSKLADLDQFFKFQLDQVAGNMAAFTAKDPTDKEAYMQKYTPLLSDPTINMKTIFIMDKIVGSISKFEIQGDAEITYWINRKYWGKGIATKALELFLIQERMRPIFGRTAFDNIGSQKVLLNNGFIKTGSDTGFANARQAEIEEFVYRLD
jgi:RimJ/RimL family protein N-acetyltransferase